MGNIKYFVMDVDGTLTDGKIYMGTNGELVKAFNIKDGYGIHNILIPSGIVPVIITGRKSDIVFNRAKELGITEIYQGISDKVEVLNKLVPKINSVAYIGDDMNDYSCIQLVKDRGGIVGCPADAAVSVKKIADFISIHNGGEGAVREFIEWCKNRHPSPICTQF